MGTIAGIAVVAVLGLAMALATIFLIRKNSHRRQAIQAQTSCAEALHGAAMHEMDPNTKHAPVLELPAQYNLAAGELQGDAPAVIPRGATN